MLSAGLNPLANGGKLTALYHYRLWIANNQGFGMSNDLRANYFTGSDLHSDNPRVEALVTGGSTYLGSDMGDFTVIKMLDSNNLPTLEWLKAHPEYWTAAVFCGGDGTPRKMLQSDKFTELMVHPAIANTDAYPTLLIESWKVKKVSTIYSPLDF